MSPIATPTAIDIGSNAVIHLPTGLAVHPLEVSKSYWNHADRQPELSDGRILSMFDYTDTWSWRERHADGDELALLLSGDVEFELDGAAGRQTIRLRPGQGTIVPAGTWHRAVIHAPSRMAFVTPTPARTEHRPAKAEGDPE